MKWVEIAFDIIYLSTIFLTASLLYKSSVGGSIRWKFAIMSFLLGVGDSFHLIPRIISLLDEGPRNYKRSLGIGKMITSITMTIFYLFLWEIGKDYYGFNISKFVSLIIYGLAFMRIAFCLFPQNQWTSDSPSFEWGLIRNIPFVILGSLVMAIFLIGTMVDGGDLPYLWLAILISFACYIPVVLYVHKKPMVGMLMLPKSCAYVAIVLMGFNII